MSELVIERLLPDGVYLDLPEGPYFRQDRLGSTDICDLFTKREGAWWSSPLNPDYQPESEDASARTYGKALHALILEGDRAYEERFALIPSKEEMVEKHGTPQRGGLFCVTVADMELGLEKRGFNPKKMSKAELVPYCRSRAPDLIIWDDYQAKWKKENEGKLPLTPEEDRQLRLMTKLAREHKDIGPFLTYDETHLPLVEVSILWTEQHGVRTMRRRARLDGFFPAQTLDLKALLNLGNRPLSFAVGDHLAKWAYQVQMADHHVARKWAYRMIREGKIHDGTPPELQNEETRKRFAKHKAWLSRYPDDAPNWEYVWMFYQRPDSKAGKAPIIFPWQEDYGSDLHMDGLRGRMQAINTYLQAMAQFGPDNPWTRVEPVHTSRDGAQHRVFLPAHVAQPEMPGESEEL